MLIALPNKRGVTLIEVMISLVILLIVFMGLIQASLLSIEHNMRNEMRDEAVKIAAATVQRLKQTPFAATHPVTNASVANPLLFSSGGGWVDRDLRYPPPGTLVPDPLYDANTNTDVAAGSVAPWAAPDVANSSASIWRYIRNIRQLYTRQIRIQNLDAASDTDVNLSLKRVEVRVRYNHPKTGEQQTYTMSTTVRNK